MGDALPAPLVPAHVDLRGYEFMPFYGERCFGSVGWKLASKEGRLAMLALWWRAYAKELPAGSLPNTDVLLRDYAGYESNPRAWKALRDEALYGFVECSDGRLYHRVLSVLAIEAWEFRNNQRNRTKAAREARLSRVLSQNENAPPKHSVTESTGQDRTGQDRSSKPPAPSDLSLEAGGAVNGHDPTIVESIPLVGGHDFAIRKPLVTEFERLYPAVDVLQTLREIRGWCLANPSKRKTERGALRFVNSWMAREQNKG